MKKEDKMITVIAIAALLLGVALLFAVVDLTREIRAFSKRLQKIESWWYGNRDMLRTLTFIFPKLENLADDAANKELLDQIHTQD